MTEQTTPAASDMSPDAPCRVLIAPCGCLVGGDITMSGPGFCRTRAEADEDAARGYREEVRTVAEFRAARLCGDATWHTPGDAPRATTGPSPTVAATKAGVSDVPDLTEAVEAAARAYYEHAEGQYRPDGLRWEDVKPIGQLAYRDAMAPVVAAVASLIERDARAAVRDLTPTEQADAIGGLIEVQWMCEPLRFRVVGPWRERVLVCTEVSNA